MFALCRHCVVSERTRGRERERERREETRQDNCQGSATIVITRMGEGGRRKEKS